MGKKIAITARPQVVSPQADKWISERPNVEPEEKTTRLTVDIPEMNHSRFKALCAIRKRKMAEEINAFIVRSLKEAEEKETAL